MSKRFEICTSCLRRCELIADRSESDLFLQKLKDSVNALGLKIEVTPGQCQRYCPEGRVTITTTWMGASPGNSLEHLVQYLRNRSEKEE